MNDLLQLTLNAKAARKIGFPIEELVERELIIAQGILAHKKSFDTVSLTLQVELTHAYSTHGELLFA
jgi:hypothetical protein